MSAPAVYNRGSVTFHWGTALAIIAMWPIGKIMVGTSPPSAALYAIHVGLGLVVAGATLARVVWVIRTDRPEHLEMPRWERVLFAVNHYVLYGLLALLSISGIAMLLAAGGFDAEALAKNDGPSDQHRVLSIVFLLMFVMHVAGVVYYQVRKGRTLRRMRVPIGS
ncbi:MAG: cytochrome b/b6 domain-containing protein [Acidimicrobiia bacterium]|nr:cytochrome b/b6 domain-containing protein [Acidimicrobiia bacterium]